jgi:hypothetical protein
MIIFQEGPDPMPAFRFFVFLAFWLAGSAGVSYVAKAKGRSHLSWLCVSIVLSPPFAALLVLGLPTIDPEREACGACSEMVKRQAVICPFCRTPKERSY